MNGEQQKEKRYWRWLYLVVLGWLVLLIVLFCWFTNVWK